MNYDHPAVRKAYPDAVIVDDGNGVFKEDGTEITIDQTLVDAARVELNKLSYKTERRIGITTTYPSLDEQFDQLYRDINAGKFGADAKTGEWFVGITSVKTAHPKP